MNLPVYMHTSLSVSACFPVGGAAQAFILHAFGGVYLDPDVECLHPLDLISEQHTLILQSEPRPGMCLVPALLWHPDFWTQPTPGEAATPLVRTTAVHGAELSAASELQTWHRCR